MYKLILVDDEEEERKGIINKIEWDKYGFEIVGEAENGIEALEIAERVEPDIVITDIRMPFMDGLTLCSKIRNMHPNTKIIILTGFDQFEYAQKAIKFDVIEYILKPVSSRELLEVLIKVKKKMDDEIAQKKDIEILKEYYNKSFPVLRHTFLCSLVTKKIRKDEILEKLDTYDIKIMGKIFAVALISINFNKIEDAYSLSDIRENDIKFNENIEYVKLGVLNVCEEIVEKYEIGISFMNEDFIVLILSNTDDNNDIFMSRILLILEEIRQSIKKFYNISCTIGIGSLFKEIDFISNAYKSAASAVSYGSIIDDNIIYIEDVEPQTLQEAIFDQFKEKKLSNSIKFGTKNEMVEIIEGLFKEIVDSKMSYKNYHIFLIGIINTILKVIQDLHIDLDNIFDDNYDMFYEILKIKEIKEVELRLIDICLKIKSKIVKERQNSYKQIVQASIKYINENYNDSELSVEKVCKILHVSPAYFSTIFKKETKCTFVNYLTNIRMEVAKELLRTTDYKTLEIARRVGYSEPNYFSYCFKKNFNISPSDYRNSF